MSYQEVLLGEERRTMIQLMRIWDKLYSKRIILVRNIVHGEGVWAAQTGRAIMFARERARDNEVDRRISSAQLMIKQRQNEAHPPQSQQQRSCWTANRHR